MKEVIRTIASRVIVDSGMASLGRRLADRSGAIILYGHRVADDDEGFMQGLKPEWLDQQLAYLKRYYQIIPLRMLVECIASGKSVPSQSVVLTFDDGFRDNLTNALPVLQKHEAPATIFAVTGSLSSGELPWSQRIGFILQTTPELGFRHRIAGDGEVRLSSPEDRHSAYRRIKGPLGKMIHAERDLLIKEIADLLRVEPPCDRMLTWEEARYLQSIGIEIGAHTYSHALLARIPMEQAKIEMARSRDDLANELGIDHPSFCFPAGSVNKSLLNLARSLGFASAFLPGQNIRVNKTGIVDCFSLSRVGFPNAPGFYLEAELDGPLQFFRSTARRLMSQSDKKF